MKLKFGIIGAGIAGAWLANRLSRAGHEVLVFEKSRGLGGRMATRRRDELAFDHGAQFFTARTAAFRSMLDEHPRQIAEWQPKVVTLGDVTKPYKRDWFEPHYVGMPGMGGICRALLDDTTVELETEVSHLAPVDDGWLLSDQTGKETRLDWVISTAPAEQTVKIMPGAALDRVVYSPCFALMVPLESRPAFDAAVVRGSALEWLAVTSSRPGRSDTPGMVAHASPQWSQAHYDDDREPLIDSLLLVLRNLGISVGSEAALHRWRYARVVTTHDEPYWLDYDNKLAACGDWGVGPRVEDAFTSADRLSTALLTGVLSA